MSLYSSVSICKIGSAVSCHVVFVVELCTAIVLLWLVDGHIRVSSERLDLSMMKGGSFE